VESVVYLLSFLRVPSVAEGGDEIFGSKDIHGKCMLTD